MNEPSEFRLNDEACAGPVTRIAVIGLASASVSLPRTPGAGTFSVPPSATVYVSLFATGGVLHVGSVLPAGSAGAAGEQVWAVVGKTPTGLPFVVSQ